MRNVSQEAHTILVSARAHADQEKQQIIKEAMMKLCVLRKTQMKILNVKSVTLKRNEKAISDVALSAASQLIKKEMDEKHRSSSWKILLNRQAINNGRLHALCRGSI